MYQAQEIHCKNDGLTLFNFPLKGYVNYNNDKLHLEKVKSPINSKEIKMLV